MRPADLLLAFAIAALGLTPASAGATTLTMENVFDAVPGSGPAGANEQINLFGFYQPSAINPADGQPFLTASAPGEIARYPAGFPRDEALVDALRVYNNTAYNITSLTLKIVGSAVEPEPFNFTFTLDPNVSAFWGDANGDGKVGLSDIFSTVTLSADRRTITFSDGLIPVGGRFTDFIFSMTDNGEPFKAGVYASFDGSLAVPEPATWAILLMGLGAAGVLRRRPCSLLVGLFGVVLIAFSQTAMGHDRPTKFVSTVEQLYERVNDPANADTLVVLAPGIYTLTPNGGSLVLQAHMGLAGYNEYADVDGDGIWDEVVWPAENGFPVTQAFARPKTETVIDGTGLTINNGVIRVGQFVGQQEADNSVSRLTVKGGLPAAPGTGGAEVRVAGLPLGSSIRVTDCLLERGQRGILLLPRLNNVTSHLIAERNIFRDHDLFPHTMGSSRGWGIHLDPEGSNGIALSNVSLTAELRYNRFYNNRVGLFIVHIGTDDSDNTVVSQSNIYDSQSPGGIPGFGSGIFTQISSSSAGTHRSRNKLISNNDTIVNNVGNGGVFAQFRAPGGNALQENEINLSLVGTAFVKLNVAGGLDGEQNRTAMGKRADVNLIDLNLFDPSGPNISGNRMTILLRQTSTSSAPISTDSYPKPFFITDRAAVTPEQVSIRVIGNDVSFSRTNSGFNGEVPTDDFTGDGPDGN